MEYLKLLILFFLITGVLGDNKMNCFSCFENNKKFVKVSSGLRCVDRVTKILRVRYQYRKDDCESFNSADELEEESNSTPPLNSITTTTSTSTTEAPFFFDVDKCKDCISNKKKFVKIGLDFRCMDRISKIMKIRYVYRLEECGDGNATAGMSEAIDITTTTTTTESSILHTTEIPKVNTTEKCITCFLEGKKFVKNDLGFFCVDHLSRLKTRRVYKMDDCSSFLTSNPTIYNTTKKPDIQAVILIRSDSGENEAKSKEIEVMENSTENISTLHGESESETTSFTSPNPEILGNTDTGFVYNDKGTKETFFSSPKLNISTLPGASVSTFTSSPKPELEQVMELEFIYKDITTEVTTLDNKENFEGHVDTETFFSSPKQNISTLLGENESVSIFSSSPKPEIVNMTEEFNGKVDSNPTNKTTLRESRENKEFSNSGTRLNFVLSFSLILIFFEA